jgi:hypothetical protein
MFVNNYLLYIQRFCYITEFQIIAIFLMYKNVLNVKYSQNIVIFVSLFEKGLFIELVMNKL